MEECEARHNNGQLEPFLVALYNVAIPEPGVQITFPDPSVVPRNIISCPDSTDTALFGVTMLPLLATLTTVSCTSLFVEL